jgi:hypothetical protein
MPTVTFEYIGKNAFLAYAFDPYNSADTSSKWLVERWSDRFNRCDCGARVCIAFRQDRLAAEMKKG